MLVSLLLASASMIDQANAVAPTANVEPMRCETGPLRRTYGGHGWLVYSCTDSETLVIVADEGNPGQPFYFIFHKQDGAYRLGGEGNGSRQATEAAFTDLSGMTTEAIAALIRDTQTVR